MNFWPRLLTFLLAWLALSAAHSSHPQATFTGSDGHSYSPIQQPATTASRSATNANPPATLYKGQWVQASASQQQGQLSGNILVKVHSPTALQTQYPQQSIALGDNFLLLMFDEHTNLLAAQQQLLQHPDVESATLEVSLPKRRPR